MSIYSRKIKTYYLPIIDKQIQGIPCTAKNTYNNLLNLGNKHRRLYYFIRKYSYSYNILLEKDLYRELVITSQRRIV